MSHFVEGNQITLLRNGSEFFPALEQAIDQARHEIHLQTYIYAADATGVRIGAALRRAAARGVRVHIMLDGFGSKDLAREFVQEMQDAGVQVLFFRPKISPWTLKRNRLRRLHRKVSVFDGCLAFVGGINIIDDMNVPGGNGPRIDYAVKVEGTVVPNILISARNLWRGISWVHLQQVDPSWIPASPDCAVANSIRAMYVVRDNMLHRRDIEHAYMKAILHAKSEIIIANAYFVPGRRFRQALLHAAKRGVKVKLLLQGRMEHMLMLATHAFYSSFLRQGIDIYEYRKSFMHSKVAVIDGQWATVGSSNIDPFSLLLSREANIVVHDAGFAQALQDDIELGMARGAVQIRPEDWRHGHLLQRGISWIMFAIVRFFLGIIGYPKKH